MCSLVVKITCSVAAEARCHRVATYDLSPSYRQSASRSEADEAMLPTKAVVGTFCDLRMHLATDRDIQSVERSSQLTASKLSCTVADILTNERL